MDGKEKLPHYGLKAATKLFKDAKVIFVNIKQLLCSNNHSLEMKNKLQSYIWSFALYGSETWTVGKSEERVVNGFETWSWRGMLKIKCTDTREFQ